MRGKQLHILLVEDNDADAALLRECLKDLRAPWRLTVAPDGEDALLQLQSEASVPHLILLDLKLPRKSGLEVLAEVKSHPKWRAIPVIVLSSSRAAEDIERAYQLYANCYVSKPADLDQYMNIVRIIERFWSEMAELPRAVLR